MQNQLARLKALGYWCPPTLAVMRNRHGPADPYVKFLAEDHDAEARSGKPFLPDPAKLIEILGRVTYDDRIPRYLEAGRSLGFSMGFATCRCCGVAGPEMGSSDLTDGVWVWPEGFSHYVRSHSLPLPDAVLETMLAHDYRVPSLTPTDVTRLNPGRDFDFWHDWSADVYRRGSPNGSAA
jgi:hypothetical protein